MLRTPNKDREAILPASLSSHPASNNSVYFNSQASLDGFGKRPGDGRAETTELSTLPGAAPCPQNTPRSTLPPFGSATPVTVRPPHTAIGAGYVPTGCEKRP